MYMYFIEQESHLFPWTSDRESTNWRHQLKTDWFQQFQPINWLILSKKVICKKQKNEIYFSLF